MNEGFSVDVGTMELPGGGTRLPINCLVGEDNSLHRKRSIIQIKNTDNNCLARAIGATFAVANTVSLFEIQFETKVFISFVSGAMRFSSILYLIIVIYMIMLTC